MKIEITYKSNDELWSMEYLMENHGYTKTADCYWAQIYEDSNGNKIITSRESSTDGDPLDELKKTPGTERGGDRHHEKRHQRSNPRPS